MSSLNTTVQATSPSPFTPLTLGRPFDRAHASEQLSPVSVSEDGYAGSTSPAATASLARPTRPRPGSVEIQNPVVGKAEPPPRLVPGGKKSPIPLLTEADYFREARRVIESAKKGDIICVQMYEFENAATNGDHDAPKNAPGYADQQALLPALVEAAKRGVKVNVILDASKGKEGQGILNQPIADYLKKHAGDTGNMTVDFYPPETVNIDHAKQLIKLTPAGNGAYVVEEALGGGSNWGNHTPANDDGGFAVYQRDALGFAQIFFRDQAFCRGDRTSPPNPVNNTGMPVQWYVTAPKQQGGGSNSILQSKLSLLKQADGYDSEQFCLTHRGLLAAITPLGNKVRVRFDPNEQNVNKNALWTIRKAHGTAVWANTEMDPNMPGQKQHSKIDMYYKHGVPFAISMGTANDTNNGLESTFTRPNPKTGADEEHKTNHEIDVVFQRVTEGDYSTAPLIDAFKVKFDRDFKERSLDKPPDHLSGTEPGQF